jgi:hypothetical protein
MLYQHGHKNVMKMGKSHLQAASSRTGLDKMAPETMAKLGLDGQHGGGWGAYGPPGQERGSFNGAGGSFAAQQGYDNRQSFAREEVTEAKAVLLVQKMARTEASPEALMRMIKWTEEAITYLQPNIITVVTEM